MDKKETQASDSTSTLDLSRDQLISLLHSYLVILPPRWSSLQNYINIYTSVLVAIFAATITGLSSFNQYPVNLLLLFGPALAFILCEFAKRTVGRQHKHVKELIALTAKLEYEIGLYDLPESNDKSDHWKPFPDDPTFIVPAWAKSRIASGRKSDDFINEFRWSSAKLTHRLFTVLQIASVILAIAIIMFPFLANMASSAA